ncbi:type III restriction endonuclease subunit R, partial [bacterium (Candidatus Blackallbacteria) CG17_big_fil_post_rev_8_21_14_2_50_48_46]
MEVLNQLNPILGLEVTATPQVERGNNTIKFENVVFEYSLAKAIEDGFVKEPAVATRRNFDPAQYSQEELDRLKLEDGIRLHEDTKVALDIFARDTGARAVKPFVLVVAKDTSHAAQLIQMIKSPGFFDGNYADKVIEIHSSQKGDEKEENIQQLLSLEHPLNKVEIVVHVNMLKEGWDVTNLYTIIPLRTAASMTLREQTIGRGLRLPYGKRTGNSKVDKLTIVAHDKFQEIIEEANKPGSIIKLQNVIEIDEQEIAQKKEVLTVKNAIETRFIAEAARIATLTQPEEQQKARVNLEAHKTLISILPQISQTSSAVKSIHDLKKSEVKELVVQKVREHLANAPQQNMFAEEIVQETMAAYEAVVDEFTLHTIEIPRITLMQADEVKSGFRDFDLDTRNLNYQPISEEILVRFLREQENATDVVVGHGRIRTDRPEKLIVNEL